MASESLLDRVPPQDVEAEAALLGSMVLDSECAGEVLQIVTPACFYRKAHALTYDALVSLYDHRRAIDLITLREELESRGTLEDVGGVAFLAELAESVPSAANALEYAEIIRRKSILRNLISTCTGIVRDAYEGRLGAEGILDEAERRIFEVAEKRVGKEADALVEILKRTMEQIDQHQSRQGNYSGIPCGFRDLDDLTAGFQNAEMIIIAGRPSMGKTTLALNFMRNISLQEKVPVAIFSMEMAEQTLAQNLLCMQAGIDASRLRSGRLSNEAWQKLNHALGDLSEAPVFIDDTAALTVMQLRAKARRMAARHGVRLIMIDYIQLMSEPGQESRQQEIAMTSRGIKALARELDIPIIVISQLNRASETRASEGFRPRLGDLRESGALEQDADVVILIHRPDYYRGSAENPSEASDTGETDLIIAKQRNGPTGMVKLAFRKNLLRFELMAKQFHGSNNY